MVPDTSSHHRSRVLVDPPPSPTTPPSDQPARSGGANVSTPLSPPRQVASSLLPTTQNQLPFPSSLPLPPPPDFSAMLALLPEIPIRRQNKLRKPSRISATPPVLAPLSFIEEPELDLEFEHISHDVQRSSPHPLRQSLTSESLNPQDVPLPEQCEHPQRQTFVARRLTKRRRPSLAPIPQEQVVSSSSGAAAAAAVTGNPAAPIAALSQISSHSKPHRARSDNGHGIRHSVSVKRQSIIRRLSMRTPKPSFESQTTSSGLSSVGPATPVSQSSGMWSRWRGAVSEAGHGGTTEDTPVSLPLVRVSSPFSIHMPSKQDSDDLAPTVTIPPTRTDMSDSRPCTLSHYDPGELSNPISNFAFTRPRAKFTLEGNESEAETSMPPSPILGMKTLGRFTPDSQRGPPSRTQSAHDPRFLAPLPNPEPTAKVSRRRWTFAMAMTDEDITDEVLVEELERMRLRKTWSGSVDDMSDIWDPDYVLFGTFGSQELTDSPQEDISPQRHHLIEHSDHSLRDSKRPIDLSYTASLPSFPHQHRINSAPLPDSGSTQQWQTARRVLLTCRELVRTERHYLASLKALLASETETAPPPLMLRYAEELAKVSQSFLAQIEGNPSSWGVAAAFLGVEEAFDGAFVGWCGVVGVWFDNSTDDASKTDSRAPSSYPRKLTKSSKQKLNDEFNEKEDQKAEEETTIGGRVRKMSSWRRSLSSITDAATSASSVKKKEKGSTPPPSFSLYGPRQRRKSKTTKKPPIRDLAILPTQRILRYVLLYRDLLAHTPSTSPSRGLIKRAADAALRIAQRCDRAQTNSAFIVDKNKDDPPPPAPMTSPTVDVTPSSEGDIELSASISKLSSATGTS